MSGRDFFKGRYFFFALFFLDGTAAVKGATSLRTGWVWNIALYKSFLFNPP